MHWLGWGWDELCGGKGVFFFKVMESGIVCGEGWFVWVGRVGWLGWLVGPGSGDDFDEFVWSFGIEDGEDEPEMAWNADWGPQDLECIVLTSQTVS